MLLLCLEDWKIRFPWELFSCSPNNPDPRETVSGGRDCPVSWLSNKGQSAPCFLSSYLSHFGRGFQSIYVGRLDHLCLGLGKQEDFIFFLLFVLLLLLLFLKTSPEAAAGKKISCCEFWVEECVGVGIALVWVLQKQAGLMEVMSAFTQEGPTFLLPWMGWSSPVAHLKMGFEEWGFGLSLSVSYQDTLQQGRNQETDIMWKFGNEARLSHYLCYFFFSFDFKEV